MDAPDWFNRFARWLGDRAAWMFLGAVVFTAYEVVMRYVFNAPTVWVHELTIGLSATAFVIAGSYTLQRGDHIRISLLYERVPPRLRRWLDRVNTLLALAFLCALGWGAAGQAGRSISVLETTGTASGLPLPMWLKSVLVFGAGLMILQALAILWRQVTRPDSDKRI